MKTPKHRPPLVRIRCGIPRSRGADRPWSRRRFAAAIADHLHYQQGVSSRYATRHDWYMALALAVRDRLLDRYLKTIDAVLDSRVKVVAYLSAEFLTGPHLGNHLLNLGIREAAAQALSGFGQNLEDVLEEEEEPGLGNGGLGPAGRVLHGFAGHTGRARHRIRHPLRVRHLRPGDP